MSSRRTRSFHNAFDSLPDEVKERATDAFRLFQGDPHHRSLRLKKVHASEPIYSVRITLSYRALALRANKDWIWFWIGSHADYEKLLNQL